MLRFRLHWCFAIGLVYDFIALASASDTNAVQFILTNAFASDVDYDSNSTYWIQKFHPQCNTSVIIPGWRSSAFDEEFVHMAQAYAAVPNECFNTIRVNWPDALTEDYVRATNSMRRVAEQVAIFLRKLQRLKLVKKVEVVGFSLGAHLAGLVGRILRDFLGQGDLISEIIGLDPAGPGFTDLFLPHRLEKLNSTDARIVVVLMTNAGCSGTSQHLGLINFIANNGRDQTGCATHDCICSHRRALDYFTESLSSDGFVGKMTTNQDRRAIFGRSRSTWTRPGDYTFKTHMASPYAL